MINFRFWNFDFRFMLQAKYDLTIYYTEFHREPFYFKDYSHFPIFSSPTLPVSWSPSLSIL